MEAGVPFKVVETGGKTVGAALKLANPTETKGCTDRRCVGCRSEAGAGGNCRKSNINYEMECQLCPPGRRAKYIGESSRNLFSRGQEHESKYRNRKKGSCMLKQVKEHNGAASLDTVRVTGSDRDCLTRQVRESVKIKRCQEPVLNAKSEWHQPALWQVQSEICRG